MSEIYGEEDYLQLSGIQHFAYCRRQWALIHIERQWAENGKTADGRIFHSVAHDQNVIEKRGNTLVAHGLPVKSAELGFGGECDVVEFRKSSDGVTVRGFPGLWLPYPVEYKRGSPKEHDADKLQLCAQAICLEEMLLCEIPGGCLLYGEPRRRTEVEFTRELRDKVFDLSREMHDLWETGYTPKARPRKSCSACSLNEICVPKLDRAGSVDAYIERSVAE